MKLPYSSENPDDMYVYRTTPGDTRGFRYIPQQGASEKLVFYIKDSAGKWVLNQPGAFAHTAFRNYSKRGNLHSLLLSFEDARDLDTPINFTRENPGTSMTASPNALPYSSSSDPNDMYVYITDTGETRGFRYIPQQGASEKLVFYIKDNAGKWVLNQPNARWAKHAAFRNYVKQGNVHSFDLSFQDARDANGKRMWFEWSFTRETAQTPPAQTPPAQTPPAQTPPAQTPPAQTPPSQTPPTPRTPYVPLHKKPPPEDTGTDWVMYAGIGGGVLFALLVVAFFFFLNSARNKKLQAQNTSELEIPPIDGTPLQIAQDAVMALPVAAPEVKNAIATTLPVVTQVAEAAGVIEKPITTSGMPQVPQVPQASFGQPRVL